MPINARNPFKGRQYAGEVIVLCVRWYLRYPLSCEHVSELAAERGVEWTPVAFGAGCRHTHRS
jgi:transposase-like protein